MPAMTNRPSGSSLAIARPVAVPTPQRTPTTLIAVSAIRVTTTISVRPGPSAAPGQAQLSACAKPTVSEPTEATRVSQVIQPTSKPTSSPKAVRA